MSALLVVEDLEKHFGGLTAVDGASFEVEAGSVTGLIGPNGAGKTTTFDCISGFYEPDGGVIRYAGTDIQELMGPSREEQAIWLSSAGIAFGGLGVGAGGVAGLSAGSLGVAGAAGAALGGLVYAGQAAYKSRSPGYRHSRPYQLATAGLVRTFQITRELTGMTVLENLMLAPTDQRGEHLLSTWFRPARVDDQERAVRDRAIEMLEFLEIDHLADERAGNLSGGQRKLLELGRVLMTDPEFILLDEPVAGVNPSLTRKLLEHVETLRAEGYTFLVVEHDMEVIMDISDTVIVMSEGSTLMEGTPEDVRADDRVIDAYLGA